MRPRWATTPAVLRVLSILVVATMIVAGFVDVAAVHHRRRGLRVEAQGHAVVATAASIRTDLDDAAVARAADDLATASIEVGIASPAERDVLAMDDALPGYADVLGTDRRDAPTVLQQILPADAALAAFGTSEQEHGRLAATASADTRWVLGVSLLLLLLLVIFQVYLVRRTRRLVNLGLAASSLVAIVVMVIGLTGRGSGDPGLITAATGVAVVICLIGIRPRIAEYR